MSGKGDRNRTADREAFWKNWDNIYSKDTPPAKVSEDPVARKLREWNWMYDCLQNIHLYEHPAQEAKELLKRIKV